MDTFGNYSKQLIIIIIIIANSYIAHFITERNTNALNKKQKANNKATNLEKIHWQNANKMIKLNSRR